MENYQIYICNRSLFFFSRNLLYTGERLTTSVCCIVYISPLLTVSMYKKIFPFLGDTATLCKSSCSKQ